MARRGMTMKPLNCWWKYNLVFGSYIGVIFGMTWMAQDGALFWCGAFSFFIGSILNLISILAFGSELEFLECNDQI
jgi:hypothetical protein